MPYEQIKANCGSFCTNNNIGEMASCESLRINFAKGVIRGLI